MTSFMNKVCNKNFGNNTNSGFKMSTFDFFTRNMRRKNGGLTFQLGARKKIEFIIGIRKT